MTKYAPAELSCDKCVFWRHAEAMDGICRLLAPRPGVEPNPPAHWGRTRREDFCGEWRAEDDAKTHGFVSCAHCRYWAHVPGGIMPIDLSDQLEEWWSRAGHCKRHPPRPSTLSGAKAHWLVTNEIDGCFEGMEKPSQ
jgi:hypothetical protein